MTKKFIPFFLCSLLLSAIKLSAQNLALNPSFENTTSCPGGISDFVKTIDWDDTNSDADSCSSPDLYAACSPQMGGTNSPNGLLGYQASRTGSHHAGIILADGFGFGCGVPQIDNYRE
ncbi:MAG: hypothetical protein AAB221_14330, partial [Bacteroidota bacterium]